MDRWEIGCKKSPSRSLGCIHSCSLIVSRLLGPFACISRAGPSLGVLPQGRRLAYRQAWVCPGSSVGEGSGPLSADWSRLGVEEMRLSHCTKIQRQLDGVKECWALDLSLQPPGDSRFWASIFSFIKCRRTRWGVSQSEIFKTQGAQNDFSAWKQP